MGPAEHTSESVGILSDSENWREEIGLIIEAVASVQALRARTSFSRGLGSVSKFTWCLSGPALERA